MNDASSDPEWAVRIDGDEIKLAPDVGVYGHRGTYVIVRRRRVECFVNDCGRVGRLLESVSLGDTPPDGTEWPEWQEIQP